MEKHYSIWYQTVEEVNYAEIKCNQTYSTAFWLNIDHNRDIVDNLWLYKVAQGGS